MVVIKYLFAFCFSAEYDHVLSLKEQKKLAEVVTEEVAIGMNAAYQPKTMITSSLLKSR